MKKLKYIFSVLLVFYVFSAYSQSDSLNIPWIYHWQLNEDETTSRVEMDTLLEYFSYINPTYYKKEAVNFTSYLGAATQSLNYFDRNTDRKNKFIFLEPYRYYMHSAENVLYYNTRKPFTDLYHTSGGPKEESEQTLGALHTRNINPKFNVGIDYDLQSSRGRYSNSNLKGNYVTFLTSYLGERYQLHGNFIYNQIEQGENGGIDSLSYLGDEEYRNSINIPVKLDEDAYTELENYSFFLQQSFQLFRATKKQVDSTAVKDSVLQTTEGSSGLRKILSNFSIAHSFYYDKSLKKYIDSNPDENFYDNYPVLIDTFSIHDEAKLNQLSNSIYFRYAGKNLLLDLGYNNSIEDYFYKIKPDSVFTSTDTSIINSVEETLYNNSISSHFELTFSDRFDFGANAEYFFQGYQQNDYNVNAYVQFSPGGVAGRLGTLSIELDYASNQPDYFYQNFMSHSFAWDTSFLKVNETKFSFSYKNDHYDFEIGVDYSILDNHIYFDTLATVRQNTSTENILGIFLRKDFHLWKIHLLNQILYQNSTSEYIKLPVLSFNHSLYYEDQFHFKSTNGDLMTRIGIDFRYMTSFYADQYMPMTGVFYNQDEVKIGDYPFIDVYISFRIKRARIFVKYSNLSEFLFEPDYFTSPYYPLEPATLKFGVSWFFDD